MNEPTLPHPAPRDPIAAVIDQRMQALAADALQLCADADRLAAGLIHGVNADDTARIATLAQRIHGQASRIEGLHDARRLT